jgi:hypothetical protein
MEGTAPGSCFEPEVSVPVSVIGDTAELMTLAAELIDAGRDGVIRARIEALLDAKGAEPAPAADWMITSVRRLARETDSILSSEGIACDRGLARYWKHPARRPEGQAKLWRRSLRPPRRTTPRPPTSGCAATWPTSG